jgi:recombination protein RecT
MSTQNTNTAVVKSNGEKLRGLLTGDKFKAAVAQALPKHLPPDRFIRIALTAMTRTPKLAECDQESFFAALLTLSQLGIEPDGRRAHLIPFENRKRGCVEVQLIVDYKGLAELVMRSGVVSNIHADVVCENDIFTVDRGEIKEHKINYREPRGKIYAAYAICRFKDGSEKAEVMTREEIEAIRGRSRAGDFGPWKTDWSEMAKKTVFRRLSKWLPLSPEERDAVEVDDDQYEMRKFDASKPVFNELKPVDTLALPEPATQTISSGMTEVEKAEAVTREQAELAAERNG